MDFVPSADGLAAIREGAAFVQARASVFHVEGPAAVDCLQGILTNDVVGPGEHSLVYGAVLTPKGMIVTDLWSARLGADFMLVAEAAAREPATAVFTRSLPPRLARVRDRSESARALWLLGPAAGEALVRAGLGTLPEAGRVTAMDDGTVVAAGGPTAPFSGLIVAGEHTARAWGEKLESAGALNGDDALLASARVLAGWPTLGREIDERTLPQEVRFDELGGVSYSKGCYTGQETVARVHFRGHVNRMLRGVVFEGALPLAERSVRAGEREVGSVRSTVAAGDRLLALAMLRREVAEGDPVQIGERTGRVAALPFAETPARR
ncbi:MAG: YgfZ/GcvT domain-containing protein [Gemmatimonadales bacterium]